MKIIVGMLAWNEENSIAATLASLAGQSLLGLVDGSHLEMEIIVVPNGCSDRTPSVAATALSALHKKFPAVVCRVESLAEGGKSNAWNTLIHQLSPDDADYFILLDADIELLTPSTIESLWRTLETNQHAIIATDLPVKHLSQAKHISLAGRVLLAAGGMTRATPGQLTGQLYAARASWLRRVWIPRGLIVEDGFLKQILCTNGFSEPPDNSRIALAPNASHLFECYTKFRDIWNHQVRQAAGHTLYTYFTAYLKAEVPERPVFDSLLRKSRDEPEWFQDAIQRQIAQRGWWVMDLPSLWVRWRRARLAKGWQRVQFLALAAVATPFDIAVFFASNARLKSGRIKGIWKDTRTTTLS